MLEGAIRETKEETGLDITIKDQLGIYTNVDGNITYQHYIFIADLYTGELTLNNDELIIGVAWHSIADVMTMDDSLLLNSVKLRTIISDAVLRG